ncbi:MAG: phage/plasmid primase, P4 family [Tabrizicola sp.]|jgi:putative DNA primase/helicase|nr:phage/plasmid primase, P4 family [Tabrizicola sp.]
MLAGPEGVAQILAGAEDVSVPPGLSRPGDGLEAADPPDFEPTELALADAAAEIIRQHGGRAIHSGDGFRFFNGDCFPKDPDNVPVQELLKSMVRRCGGAWKLADRARMERRATIGGAMALLASAPGIAVKPTDLDQHDLLLPCRGGVTVDLDAGKPRPSRAEDRMTRCAGVSPDFAMPTPLWHSTLMQFAGGDEDVVHFLQVLVGYFLTGSTKEQRLFYIVGRGGTGKSTFVEILRRLLGEYAAMTEAATFAEHRNEPHPAALAAIEGARLVIAPEFEGRKLDASKVKAFTGDGVLSVRGMRENFRQSPVKAKLLMVGNSEPQLRTVDDAIRRRFVLIPFNFQPSNVDPDLPEKLWAEAAGIMAWAVRGAAEWIEEGLYLPEAIIKASADYLDDQDSFGAWVREHLDLTDRDAFTSSADLFANWKGYAEGVNEQAGTAKAFGSKLRKFGLSSSLRRWNGAPTKGWEGCRLRSAAA